MPSTSLRAVDAHAAPTLTLTLTLTAVRVQPGVCNRRGRHLRCKRATGRRHPCRRHRRRSLRRRRLRPEGRSRAQRRPASYQAVRPHTLASRGQGFDQARAADGDDPTRRSHLRRDSSARLSPRGAASPPSPRRCTPAVPRDGQSAPGTCPSPRNREFGGGG